MRTTLFQFNPWWEETHFEYKVIPREKYFSKIRKELTSRDIIFLVGLRRVGKTTLLKQTINELIKEKTDPKKILYLSCEHPLFEDKTLIEIVNEYRGYFDISRDEKIYLFFDEVQLKSNFERDLKLLYDMEKDVKIFCSGSSSTILKDKKAYLTGRQKTYEVTPLDFQEYLKFKNEDIKVSEEYKYREKFLSYMKTGGIPEYVLNNDPEYLLNLIDSIIYKDIVSFYGLKNQKIIRDLFVLLCERVGKPISYNKLANILGISTDTVSQYVSYFEETYLIHIVSKYSKTLNERMRSQKKIYICDVGIRNLLVGYKDLGAIFENLVFLKIKHLEPYYYLENGKEVDFIIKDKELAIEAKFKEDIKEEDLSNIKNFKIKNKKVVSDYSFFLE